MAVDSEEKRKSAIGFAFWPFFWALPAGDGTVSQADRQQVLGAYAGILSADTSSSATDAFRRPWKRRFSQSFGRGDVF